MRVTLLDRADQGHATAAGASIVSPATSFSAPPAQNALAYRAAAYYRGLVASLRRRHPRPGYAVPGGLVVASGDAEGAQLNRAFRILAERAQAGPPYAGAADLAWGDTQSLDIILYDPARFGGG